MKKKFLPLLLSIFIWGGLSSAVTAQICESGDPTEILHAAINTIEAPAGCWAQEILIFTCGSGTCGIQTGGCDYGDVTITWVTDYTCR